MKLKEKEKEQTGADRSRQEQTGTDRNRQEQTRMDTTDMIRKEQTGNSDII